MIYSATGEPLSTIYDSGGNTVDTGYDIDGNVVYSHDIALKVMSYNVGQWYIGNGSVVPAAKESTYRNLLSTMIMQDDPDILIMCEYDSSFSTSGTTANSVLSEFFPYINAHEYGSKNGLGVASKYPISNYQRHLFTNSGSTWHSFDTFTVTVNSVPITVIATHLSYDTAAHREAEEAQIITYLDGVDTFILGGDFNTLHCDSEDTDDYRTLIKPFIDKGYNVANCNDAHGFHITYRNMHDDTGYVGRLDNIITSANILIDSVYVDTTKVTDEILDEPLDHLPIVATLQLT